jgi:hypothetical protein
MLRSVTIGCNQTGNSVFFDILASDPRAARWFRNWLARSRPCRARTKTNAEGKFRVNRPVQNEILMNPLAYYRVRSLSRAAYRRAISALN